MVELIVNNRKHILLDKQDVCPICGTPRNNMRFSWRIFHGEANSSCCGAIYQIKDYYIENPTDEEKKLLTMLAGEYIEFNIQPDYIEPLKQALNATGKHSIVDEDVVKLALHIKSLKEVNK